jgi:hypothetical protein
MNACVVKRQFACCYAKVMSFCFELSFEYIQDIFLEFDAKIVDNV